ncbi:VOC family protein [Neorhizobium sp. JUb45]|uniref:VOC family protein n=1 Tax=Neorhizobium sp. JUb45 TaxID=2485113 RepID=UPI00104D3FA8|nr:VOC family protein [Neorhizobium sp. JUb45]TCQ97314.1 catechol 2,3-dioxygenase-like lactoylglutathione lyase family enzyme [Neorhizobium sp. JUb45]
MATRFHHVNFTAKDVSDLSAFYQDVLELEQTFYGGHGEDSSDQIKDRGYGGDVTFLTDGSTEMHLATLDLNVAFKTGKGVNPLGLRGHIAFRTDDISSVKKRLTERDIPYADYGQWAIKGWDQIFFQDPEGNIVEVHQVDAETARG